MSTGNRAPATNENTGSEEETLADLFTRASAAAHAGDLVAAEHAYRDIVCRAPASVPALYNLAVLAGCRGAYGDAMALLERLLAIEPGHVEARTTLAALHKRIGDLVEAIAQYRQALRHDPANAACRINLTNALVLAKQRATLADLAPDLSPEELGRHALVACMPKSGSSFLKSALCALTGWPEAHFAYGYWQNEQEIYLPNVVAAARADVVVQQHCRATEPNIQILQAFAIRPIVLVRNLYDVIVSLVDFYDGGATANTFFAGRWRRFDRARRLDLVVDHVVPWYLAFYVSWIDAAGSDRLDCLLVRYEELMADKPAVLKHIADFLGFETSDERCTAAVAAAERNAFASRLNKGISGRGAEELDAAQRARVRALADYYPDVDFAPLGL